MKTFKKPYEALVPSPVILVSCTDGERTTIVTLAWAGTICSEPPMLSISIRPSRFSHDIIEASGEFVVNVPGEDLLKVSDMCGTRSGRDVNKFEEYGLTKAESTHVNAPMIEECPLNIECKVDNILRLGTHDMYVAEIVGVHLDEEAFKKNRHFVTMGIEYWSLDRIIGKQGYTMKK